MREQTTRSPDAGQCGPHRRPLRVDHRETKAADHPSCQNAVEELGHCRKNPTSEDVLFNDGCPDDSEQKRGCKWNISFCQRVRRRWKEPLKREGKNEHARQNRDQSCIDVEAPTNRTGGRHFPPSGNAQSDRLTLVLKQVSNRQGKRGPDCYEVVVLPFDELKGVKKVQRK